ncbi:MAG: NAD(P)/FAD-dependent oxidoreductase [Candidatus Dadabacteria bacterium]
MEAGNSYYDVAIIGGGLAGLAASILLRRSGHSVILFEKEKYPFHKVCGEYISNESRSFLTLLGVPIDEMHLPEITKLNLTSPGGRSFTTTLPLGGFGLSRYTLDYYLSQTAKKEGVEVLDQTKVQSLDYSDRYTVHFSSATSPLKSIQAAACCAAFGKKSNLDVKWRRSWLESKQGKLSNFVAIKYHIKSDWPVNTIGLHNFRGGYCGISKIEGDKYCLCYLTRAAYLNEFDNDVLKFENAVLFKNKHLKEILSACVVVEHFPITISQVSFNNKSKFENGILMLGDAAGMISPLCGNGMSIALHTAKIAAPLISAYLKGNLSMRETGEMYSRHWHLMFGKRLATGRAIQKFFGGKLISEVFVNTFKSFPFLSSPVIRMTHGSPF